MPELTSLLFARMDRACLGSIHISHKKARTSTWFTMNTADLVSAVQPGAPLFNIEHSNGGLITFPRGVLIKNAEGKIIGAIGVSSSSVENDHAVAEAIKEQAIELRSVLKLKEELYC